MLERYSTDNLPLFFKVILNLRVILPDKRAFVSQIRSLFMKSLEKMQRFGYNIEGLSRK